MDYQTNNRSLQGQLLQVNREKAKCEEDIRRFEAENSSMVKKQREMREQLMQCEKGLS